MTLSDGEKLILVMLCDLYKHLKVKSDIDPDFVLAAIHNNHPWGLRWTYPGIYSGEEPPSRELVLETADIMQMWSTLERSYAQLSQPEKQQIERDAEPFGRDVRFEGFDANHEPQHSVAQFLVDELNRFEEFKGRSLNSHSSSIEPQRRMLNAYRRIISDGNIRGALSAQQIVDVLKAQRHR